MKTDEELKEFNDFLQESPVRNKFLPIMEHICKLKPKGFNVEEWTDKLNRPVVKFLIETNQNRKIEGRVCFDWAKGDDTDGVIFEFWWGEENYYLIYDVNQSINWITLLLKRGGQPMYGFKTYEELKAFRKNRDLIEL